MITPILFVAAASAGGLVRWASLRWWHCSWQALLAVNVAGSFVLGALVGGSVDDGIAVVLGVGLAGSLTTFSSFAMEVRRSRPVWAAALVTMQLVGCLGAASIAFSW